MQSRCQLARRLVSWLTSQDRNVVELDLYLPPDAVRMLMMVGLSAVQSGCFEQHAGRPAELAEQQSRSRRPCVESPARRRGRHHFALLASNSSIIQSVLVNQTISKSSFDAHLGTFTCQSHAELQPVLTSSAILSKASRLEIRYFMYATVCCNTTASLRPWPCILGTMSASLSKPARIASRRFFSDSMWFFFFCSSVRRDLACVPLGEAGEDMLVLPLGYWPWLGGMKPGPRCGWGCGVRCWGAAGCY